jgi:hypothetical protein
VEPRFARNETVAAGCSRKVEQLAAAAAGDANAIYDLIRRPDDLHPADP